MKVLDKNSVLQLLCKMCNKWGMYLDCHTYPNEFLLAAPYLNLQEHAQFIVENGGIILFDTEEEMNKCFNSTIGDDGPTKTNPYNGNTKVYAITCNIDGQFLNENT